MQKRGRKLPLGLLLTRGWEVPWASGTPRRPWLPDWEALCKSLEHSLLQGGWLPPCPETPAVLKPGHLESKRHRILQSLWRTVWGPRLPMGLLWSTCVCACAHTHTCVKRERVSESARKCAGRGESTKCGVGPAHAIICTYSLFLALDISRIHIVPGLCIADSVPTSPSSEGY